MIMLVSGTIGAVLGAVTAKRRKGNRLDMAQYAAGYAIAFMILGLFLTLLITYLAD